MGMVGRGGNVSKEFADMSKGLETLRPHLHLRTFSVSGVYRTNEQVGVKKSKDSEARRLLREVAVACLHSGVLELGSGKAKARDWM